MNNIKFRIWDAYLKRMTYDYPPHQKLTVAFCGGKLSQVRYDDNDSGCSWSAMPDDLERGERFFAQQYVGLRDSADQEIYEGDILMSTPADEKHIALISYSEEFAAFLHGENALWRGWLGKSLVLGNIFENPELLNAKDVLN